MPITSALVLIVAVALAVGALVGWLMARPTVARLETELARDRAAHAERLDAYQQAEAVLRDAFQSLTADALQSNNRAFLDLAETRLGEARTAATADIDMRKKAIEDLLVPLKTTLER